MNQLCHIVIPLVNLNCISASVVLPNQADTRYAKARFQRCLRQAGVPHNLERNGAVTTPTPPSPTGSHLTRADGFALMWF